MYGDIYVDITEQTGSQTSVTGEGVQVKIGISPVTSDTLISITGNMTPDAIREKLGDSPLADACMDSIDFGASSIYCFPIAGTGAVVGAVDHTGSSTGTITISGTPNNDYQIVIEIVDSGAINVGTYRYSVNGGFSFSETTTIPAAGTYQIPNTGLSLAFTGADPDSFLAGDQFTCQASAPVASNQDIISAVESLKTNNLAFEFVHIIGATTKALWSVLAVEGEEYLVDYKKPCYFICETRNKEDAETYEDYMDFLKEERSGVDSIFLQVVSSYGSYMRADKSTNLISAASVIAGLYCKTDRVSQSIGEVKSFPIPYKKFTLLPAAIQEYTEAIDQLGYTTIRQYDGMDDYFVTSANMFYPEGSDFKYAENVRVMDRLIKKVRLSALQELQTEIDLTNIDVSLSVLEEMLKIPLEEDIEDGIISAGTLEIDKNFDPESENVNVNITYTQKGYVRSMHIYFALTNLQTAETEE